MDIYVSASVGQDTNDGLSAVTPKKSIVAGYALLRNGQPDRLLLRAGDVFYTGLGDWRKSGQDSTRPMIVSTYDQTSAWTQAILRTGAAPALTAQSASGLAVHDVHFENLFCHAHTRDPLATQPVSTSGSSGINWLRGAKNVKFKRVSLTCYYNGVNLQDFYKDGIDGVTFLDCAILDSYADKTRADQGHCQGMYLDGVKNVTIQGCTFDHNGWHEAVPGAYATIYNHNLYVQTNCVNVSVLDSVFMRASSHSIHFRPGGVCTGNLFFRNPISLQMGYQATPNVQGVIAANVVLEGTDIGPPTDPALGVQSQPRGWGIYLENVTSVRVEDNLLTHCSASGPNTRALNVAANVTYLNNKVWKWPTGSSYAVSTAQPQSSGPFKDPERRLIAKGYADTVSDFFTKTREVNPVYRAPDLAFWVRLGFLPA